VNVTDELSDIPDPLRGILKDYFPSARRSGNMPDVSRLGIHQGEIGPICDYCGERLTFGQSIPIDSKYACYDCYQKVTGVESSTDGKSVTGLSMD